MNKREFFDCLAEEWEAKYSSSEENNRLSNLVKLFPLQKGMSVLDMGCGSGHLIPHIQKKIGPQGLLVGADFSEKMIVIGRSKFPSADVHLVQTDAHQAGIQSELFDLVLCVALFPHLDQKLNALREFNRLLKPQGQLIIAHSSGREMINSFHSQMDGVINQDFIPEEKEMRRLLASAEFEITDFIDQPSLYLVKAQAIKDKKQKYFYNSN